MTFRIGRSAFGDELLLVPAHAILRPSSAEAERIVRDAFEQAENRHALRLLVERCAFRPGLDDESIMHLAIQLLSDGQLVIIQSERQLLTRPPGSFAGTRDIPRLSDLLDARPMQPRVIPEPEPIVAPAQHWLALLPTEIGTA